MPYNWDFGIVRKYLPLLLDGVKVTIPLAAVSMVIGAAVGLMAALGRLSRIRLLNAVAYIYVEFFRNTPILILLIWMYYCLPIIFDRLIVLSPFVCAITALSLNTGAFVSEVFRAGITSIASGQRNAALALGMTPVQAMRRIILPQAIRRMVPPLAAAWVSLFRDVSVTGVITVHDLMYEASKASSLTFRYMELLTAAAVIYVVLTYPQSRFVSYLYRRFRFEE